MRRLFYIMIIALLPFLTIHNVFAKSAFKERVYIHTDKQTYLSGEILWMKFYLTDENGKPLSFSKIGYVELLDESTAQVQIKLELINGIGEGWMELPVTLPTGNYCLTAYTRNMRNEGEIVFFNKTIAIINSFRTNNTIIVDTLFEVSATSSFEDNISVSTEKQEYTTRSQSELRIQGLPENVYSLSVAISGKDITANTESIVDWHNKLSSFPDLQLKNDFLPEYEGHIITGTIVDVSTNLPPTEKDINSLLGFVGEQVRVFGGKIDEDYNVQYFTNRITGAKEFSVANIVSSDKKIVTNIQSPFVTHSGKKLPDFILNPAWEPQILKRSVGLQVLYAFFADSMSSFDTTYPYFQWKPSRTYILDEYTRFNKMEEIITEFIHEFIIRQFNNKKYISVLVDENSKYSSGNVIILLDGIPIIDHEILLKYNPLLINKIDFYKEKIVFGGKRFEGMVYITTYKHNYPDLNLNETAHIFDYEGTQLHRFFYYPSYVEKFYTESKNLDYRHTLLWAPEIELDGKNEVSIPFSTSDLTGDYQVTVEGLTKDGKVIRGTSLFKVGKP